MTRFPNCARWPAVVLNSDHSMADRISKALSVSKAGGKLLIKLLLFKCVPFPSNPTPAFQLFLDVQNVVLNWHSPFQIGGVMFYGIFIICLPLIITLPMCYWAYAYSCLEKKQTHICWATGIWMVSLVLFPLHCGWAHILLAKTGEGKDASESKWADSIIGLFFSSTFSALLHILTSLSLATCHEIIELLSWKGAHLV